MGALARFRADPAKVRVGIRRWGAIWRVVVESRDGSTVVARFDANPEAAVDGALARADGLVQGVDLGMQRAYDHPWGAAAC